MTQPTIHDPLPAITLSPEDAALVDALLDARQPIADSPRASRARAWLKFLTAAPAAQPPAGLVQNTLARIQHDRMKLSTPPRPLSAPEPISSPPRSFAARYFREFAAMAVAASLLAVVVTLGISQARQSANRVACASNLMTLASAFSAYAADNRNQLPALAMPTDHNWLHPDPALADAHSNDANLLPLVNASLVRPVNFLCPARTRTITRTDASRGYSYVDMCTLRPPHWTGTHAAILLADRNPLFDPSAAPDPQANSANHAGRGNYVVRADGTVTWETSPNVGPDHDNIWTLGPGPQYATSYTGTESPASANDVFLCP